MAGASTHMLLLGAVALFEPVNGYQIRRELMSWQVDEWANIKPGSIYHGLRSLADKGLLLKHELDDNGRDVAVYQVTERGRNRLDELVTAALVTVNLFDRRDLHAAFGLMPLLGRPAALRALTDRRRTLADTIAELPELSDPAALPYAPPHAVRGTELWVMEARTELGWLDGVLADLASGALEIVGGEGGTWAPPSDDPGHQMTRDRSRYRELLGH